MEGRKFFPKANFVNVAPLRRSTRLGGVGSQVRILSSRQKKILTSSGDFLIKPMSHYVYILQSQKDMKYYIGETADVEARLLFHNAGRQRSTKSRIPFIIVFTEEFETRQLALIREEQIKSWKGGNSFQKLIS